MIRVDNRHEPYIFLYLLALCTMAGIHNLPGSLPAPLNRTVSPFTYGQSRIHLTVFANSSGWPNRLGYTIPSLSRLRRVLAEKLAVMLLSNTPGAIVTTRMACRARSRAMGSVMDRSAPLVAA